MRSEKEAELAMLRREKEGEVASLRAQRDEEVRFMMYIISYSAVQYNYYIFTNCLINIFTWTRGCWAEYKNQLSLRNAMPCDIHQIIK